MNGALTRSSAKEVLEWVEKLSVSADLSVRIALPNSRGARGFVWKRAP